MSAVAAAVLVALPLSADEITIASVLGAMNEYRVAAGLAPLRSDSRLEGAARDRMQHMEDEGFWSHDSPTGLIPFVWIAKRAYRFTIAGENLARGFETPRLLVDAWMESSGHRKNILSADFTDCGIAILDGSTTGPAEGRSVVVLFARE